MALSVQFRPSSLVLWSKSYFQYQIRGTLLTVGRRVQVQFIRADNSEVLADVSYPITSTTQTITIPDCQELIDPHLQYFLPSGFGTGVEELHRLQFFIQCREYAPDYAGPWVRDDANPRTVLKGGLADMNFNRELNINHSSYSMANFLPNGKKFLTWIPGDGRVLHKDEVAWITVFSDQSPGQYAKYNVYYLDGSSYTFKKALPANGLNDLKYRAWQVPLGISNARLDPYNKGVYKFFFSVWGAGIQDYGRIDIDHRYFPRARTLYYRNSFGGIDNIHLHGVVATGTTEPQKFELRQHRVNGSVDGENPYFKSRLKFKFKANTGFIHRRHKMALADLVNTNFAALLIDNKWLPMRIPPQAFDPISSEDGLHNYAIEFETAGYFETMPRQLMQLI